MEMKITKAMIYIGIKHISTNSIENTSIFFVKLKYADDPLYHMVILNYK